MARPTLSCSMLALCLLASLPLQAQPGPRDDRGRGPEAQRQAPSEPRRGPDRSDARSDRHDRIDRQRGDRPGARHDRYDRNERYDRNDRSHRDDRSDRRGRDDRYGRPDGRYQAGRGAGPGHDFYRGDRLPWEYRQRTYVVEDWRGHRLSAPPRGYHWVQTGGDYVLVAIATGVILQLLLMGH